MIRLATLQDAAAIAQLLYQVHSVHAQARPDMFKAGGRKMDEAGVAQLITEGKDPIFVYEAEGQILGHMFCKIQETPDDQMTVGRKVLFIDDLCVDQAARGQKIGEQFYQFALDYARQLGCASLTLHVFNANDRAEAFYRRLGMEPLYTEMEYRLDSDQD